MINVSPFIQYGAIGAIALACMYAVKIMFGNLQKSYEAERERSERLEQELKHLNDAVRNEYLDAMARATTAAADANRVVAEMISTRKS